MEIKFPKKLGECVDLCYKLRAQRLEIEKKVEELKEAQKRLEDHILNTFTKQDIDGAKGYVATAAVTRTTVPRVTDWRAFHVHVLESMEIDLLERRPSKSACRERWDAGEEIPGVEPFEVIGLSLTKAGG